MGVGIKFDTTTGICILLLHIVHIVLIFLFLQIFQECQSMSDPKLCLIPMNHTELIEAISNDPLTANGKRSHYLSIQFLMLFSPRNLSYFGFMI